MLPCSAFQRGIKEEVKAVVQPVRWPIKERHGAYPTEWLRSFISNVKIPRSIDFEETSQTGQWKLTNATCSNDTKINLTNTSAIALPLG